MNNNHEKENKQTLRIFAFASFLNDMGSDIIFPILPAFITNVLKANMEVMGLIMGLGDAFVSVSQAVSGYISDRIKKRKVFVWTGYLLGAFSRLGYAISVTWGQVALFKVLDRSGKIRSAPRDAIVADISTNENRGRNFGLLRMMDNLGAVVGVLICLLLFNFLGYRWLFALAAIPSLLGAAFIFIAIKERKAENQKIFKGFQIKSLNKNFILFLTLSAIFALGSFHYSFLLKYAENFGYKVSALPVLYLIFTVSAAIFSLPFGKLADTVGRKTVMLISFLFWGFTCFSFILSQNLWMSVIVFILFGLHKAALEPVQKTFVSEMAPQGLKASTLGIYQMAIGLCALPSSFLAGILWDKINLFAPLYISLILTATAIILILFVKENKASEK